MGSNVCKNGVSQNELEINVAQKHDLWQIRYGSDARRTVNHRQLIIQNPNLEMMLKPILDQLKTEKRQYSDPDFVVSPILMKAKNKMKQCKWERPDKIISEEYEIVQSYTHHIRIGDEIMQYFGAFLTFLQQHSQLIRKIICLPKNTYGLYVTKIYNNGKQQFIVIDDQFICTHDNIFVFSQPVNQSIWPLIIEKVWIKHLGSIANLEHHEPQQPYSLFGNTPYEILSIKDMSIESFYQILRQNTFAILKSKMENKIKIGLSGQKYFVVLCFFEINEQSFFLLRNTCGAFQFRGNWVEPTQGQIKKVQELGYSLKEPGNFIVDVQELDQFESAILFHYRQNYQTFNFNMEVVTNEATFIKIRIADTQQICLDITQYQASFCPLMIDFFSLPSFQPIKMNCVWGIKKLNITPRMFKINAGSYILRIKAKSLQKRSLKLGISSYSSCSIEVNQNLQYQDEFNQYLVSLSTKSLSPLISRPGFIYKLTWDSNRVLVYIKNLSKNNKALNLDVCFPTLKNLQSLDPSLIELNRGEVASITINDEYVLVLEKKELHKQTSVGEFSLLNY